MRAVKRSKNTGNCPAGQETNAHNRTMDCRARYCVKNEYEDKTVCKPAGVALPAWLSTIASRERGNNCLSHLAANI